MKSNAHELDKERTHRIHASHQVQDKPTNGGFLRNVQRSVYSDVDLGDRVRRNRALLTKGD
jgi:hypothetical protein